MIGYTWFVGVALKEKDGLKKARDRLIEQLETNMEQAVYLAGLKQGAWVTKTGQYSTDITQARTFGLTEALDRCRQHKAAGNVLIPVPVNWMDAI